ncbi:MAG: succinate dehydrogenase assembly factor 2 [Geminicoccaceae bacterium]|nr:succinate dehydrogenase assembly factor 2 [Geminicoccaceae bacterium]
MSETEATRRKRLAHRSRYRGFKEADLIFGRFADLHLAGLDGPGLDRYEALLDEADHDVVAWVMGARHVPARHDNGVFRLLRDATNGS